MPKHPTLYHLLSQSSSSRTFFAALPSDTQTALQAHAPYIHTAEQLHAYAHHFSRYLFDGR